MLQQRQRPTTSSYYFWIMRKPSQNVSAALTLPVLMCPKNLGENLPYPWAQGEWAKSRKRCGYVKPLVRKDILDPDLSSELGILESASSWEDGLLRASSCSLPLRHPATLSPTWSLGLLCAQYFCRTSPRWPVTPYLLCETVGPGTVETETVLPQVCVLYQWRFWCFAYKDFFRERPFNQDSKRLSGLFRVM